MTGTLLDDVGAAVREVAAAVILPRFRALSAADVSRKGADDLVTVADVEAESMLADRLAAIRPGVPVLGEEASHHDPALRRRLVASGTFWVVDPLDGTREFVAGREGFGVLVALVEAGVTTAAWVHLPVSGLTYDGATGQRPRRDGVELPAPARAAQVAPGGLRGFARTSLAPPDVRTQVDSAMAAFAPPSSSGPEAGSAALAYVSLLDGTLDFGLYWRTEPWDHVPGAFLVELAGGRADRLDGGRYSPVEDGEGLLVVRHASTWTTVRDGLLPEHGDAARS